jgi:tRNA G18 (ribose-2'-O)-methylase SpoU
MERDIILIAHNLRSTHNVGSLLRTADGLGISRVFLTGYTPYPIAPRDSRLPHLAQKLDRQISKTALGAERSQAWEHREDIGVLINELRAQKYFIAALEQTPDAMPLHTYKPAERVVVILGREAEGIELEVLALSDIRLMVPMLGRKESFNVVQAAAMALYQLRFASL